VLAADGVAPRGAPFARQCLDAGRAARLRRGEIARVDRRRHYVDPTSRLIDRQPIARAIVATPPAGRIDRAQPSPRLSR